MKLHPIVPVLILLLASVGCGPRHHSATATIQIVERTHEYPEGEMKPNYMMASFNINYYLIVMQSQCLLDDVVSRLRKAEVESNILAPYIGHDPAVTLAAILEEHRSVQGDQAQRTLRVSYRHPEPQIAVQVANTFADAFIAYQIMANAQASMQAVEDLSQRAEQQLVIISEKKAAIAEFVRVNELDEVSLDVIESKLRAEFERLEAEKTSGKGDSASLQSDFDRKELELIQISKLRIEYNSLKRDLVVQESFYNALKKREQLEREYLAPGAQANAVIVERASL